MEEVFYEDKEFIIKYKVDCANRHIFYMYRKVTSKEYYVRRINKKEIRIILDDKYQVLIQNPEYLKDKEMLKIILKD